MYTEPFKFEFNRGVADSERMLALSELFLDAESKGVKRESFGGYVVKHSGVVEFWSYTPDLTEIVVSWLKQKVEAGKTKVYKPKYLSNA